VGVGEPLRFVVETAERLSPRTVLDVACSRGRHLAVFAAAGAAVVGVDRDEAALAEAAARAPSAVLHRWDVEADGLPPEVRDARFDLVLTTFFLYRPLVAALIDAVAPGGHLLMETFHVENVRCRGRPRREAFALAEGEAAALATAAGLDVIVDDEGERGDVFTARLLARKPT
jgi:SAM-dependent methyltransferase